MPVQKLETLVYFDRNSIVGDQFAKYFREEFPTVEVFTASDRHSLWDALNQASDYHSKDGYNPVYPCFFWADGALPTGEKLPEGKKEKLFIPYIIWANPVTFDYQGDRVHKERILSPDSPSEVENKVSKHLLEVAGFEPPTEQQFQGIMQKLGFIDFQKFQFPSHPFVYAFDTPPNYSPAEFFRSLYASHVRRKAKKAMTDFPLDGRCATFHVAAVQGILQSYLPSFPEKDWEQFQRGLAEVSGSELFAAFQAKKNPDGSVSVSLFPAIESAFADGKPLKL